jgi:threonine dehydrogenase-like Zn-dependent dehydrogenase
MRGAILYGPGDVRFEERADPHIVEPTDAVIRTVATCVCGSDLWAYRGVNRFPRPTPFGHEYCGIVETVGSDVTTIRPGQFVIGSFFACDNTCPACVSGFQTKCVRSVPVSDAQAELVRVPLADGTLVATPDLPSARMVPSLLALSDVMGTGWFAAHTAGARPGATVVVVGDGAVGLLGVLSAARLGAERIIAMSSHPDRQRLAVEFGATDIVAERGDDGVERVKDLTNGLGSDATLECVGTEQSIDQAVRVTRPGSTVAMAGVPHGFGIPAGPLFFSMVALRGGPAPVRRYLPELIDLVWSGSIEPGRVFDLRLPLRDVADGYAAMHERRAIKVLLEPGSP